MYKYISTLENNTNTIDLEIPKFPSHPKSHP